MQTRKFIPCDCFVCCRCVCSTRDWNWNRSDVDDVAGCDSDCDVNQVWYVFWWFNTVLHDLFSHYSLHAIFFSLRILWTENCFIVDDNAPYTLDARFLATKLSSNEAKFIRLIKSSDVLLLIVIRENYFIFNLRINFIISLSSISMPDGSLLLWAYENLRKDSIKNVIFPATEKKGREGNWRGWRMLEIMLTWHERAAPAIHFIAKVCIWSFRTIGWVSGTKRKKDQNSYTLINFSHNQKSMALNEYFCHST